jgi:signal transduction histidine kinase
VVLTSTDEQEGIGSLLETTAYFVVAEGGADAAAGSGLRGLADRVSALHGVLHVSSPPGRGTRVHAEISLTG